MEPTYIFAILLVFGLLLLAAEVFVPGGILGLLGALALTAAVVLSFRVFPAYGSLVAAGIVLGTIGGFVVWLRVFPRTPIGRALTLRAEAGCGSTAAAPSAELVGKEGKTLSDLRPSGLARIDGRRRDVVTEGEMIAQGENVRVVAVEGIRVVVRKTKPQQEIQS